MTLSSPLRRGLLLATATALLYLAGVLLIAAASPDATGVVRLYAAELGLGTLLGDPRLPDRVQVAVGLSLVTATAFVAGTLLANEGTGPRTSGGAR